MKKSLYEICTAIATLIAAVLWLISSFVENFDFGVLGFFTVMFFAVGVIGIVFGIIEKKYSRIVSGGTSIAFGAIALLAKLSLLKPVTIICIVIIIGAITSILSIIVNKGNKWDAGKND